MKEHPSILEDNSIKGKLRHEKDCKVYFEGTVLSPITKAIYEETIDNIKKSASLSGYEKGSIPEKILLKEFSQQIEQEFQSRILELSQIKVIQLGKLKPFRPELEQVHVEKSAKNGTEVRFSMEIYPKVPPLELSNLKINKIFPPEITKEMIDRRIELLQFSYGTTHPITNRSLQIGDFIEVEILEILDTKKNPPFILAEPFRSQFVCKFSQDVFPEWMIKLMTGLSIGQSIEIEHPQQDVSFQHPPFYRLTIKNMFLKEFHPADDSLAKKMNLQTLNQLREQIKIRTAQEEEQKAKNVMWQELRGILLEKISFDIPQTSIEREKNNLKEARSRGLIKSTPLPPEEENKEILRNLRLQFQLESIAEESNISVSEKELRFILFQKYFSLSEEDKKFLMNFNVYDQYAEQVRKEITQVKVINYLLDTILKQK